jgi:hypothetical protein
LTDRVEEAITTVLSDRRDDRQREGHIAKRVSRPHALVRRLWEPRALVVLALGSAALGTYLVFGVLGAVPRAPSATHAAAAPAPSYTADQAAQDVATLAATLTAPYHVLAESLGPHRVRDRSELVMVDAGRAIDSLDVTTELAFAAPGELRARSESSAGYARDLVIANGAIYTRPGHGLFHERSPETAGEARALANELASAPGAYAAALVVGAAIRSRQAVERHGRPALAVELEPGDAPVGIDAPAWGAERAEVTHARGELVLDAETGALLAAEVSGEVQVLRDGRRLVLSIALSRELSGVGETLAIDVPAGDDVIALVESPSPEGKTPRGAGRASEDEVWNEQ